MHTSGFTQTVPMKRVQSQDTKSYVHPFSGRRFTCCGLRCWRRCWGCRSCFGSDLCCAQRPQNPCPCPHLPSESRRPQIGLFGLGRAGQDGVRMAEATRDGHIFVRTSSWWSIHGGAKFTRTPFQDHGAQVSLDFLFWLAACPAQGLSRRDLSFGRKACSTSNGRSHTAFLASR